MASTLNLGAVKTPGVYIDEMSLFPPSVAQVDTAIPAFIGLTEQHTKDGQSLAGIPTKISSMVEYRRYFGGAPDRKPTVNIDGDGRVRSVSIEPSNYLFDSLTLFFANGGEKCYIVSIGTYEGGSEASYEGALDELRKYDEPTLIVIPDAVNGDAGDAAAVQQAALDHCAAMQDRFAILDVRMDNASATSLSDDDIEAFRDGVTGHLNYGAAYYPYVHTSLPLTVRFANLQIQVNGVNKDLTDIVTGTQATALAGAVTDLAADVTDATNKVNGLADITDLSIKRSALAAVMSSVDAYDATSQTGLNNSISSADGTTIDAVTERVTTYARGIIAKMDASLQAREAEMKSTIPVYAAIVAAVEKQGIIVPPSGAVAGAYARTDSDRGVWKSPANVGLNYVTGPVVRLTDSDQENLNVDVDAGKSINAIRAFTGKGTLVWGARTLAGSDNEWRYVSVRRFFLMAEESIKKATAQFVFEANDANTWVRVRAMIENFLTLQWRAGALAGAKAESAFFVRVGLGQTMTPEDVLSGFMIVEIGLAVVRPAEFIVLRFSHKMQEA